MKNIALLFVFVSCCLTANAQFVNQIVVDTNFISTNSRKDMRVADLNGDGHQDIILHIQNITTSFAPSIDSIFLLVNDGTNNFPTRSLLFAQTHTVVPVDYIRSFYVEKINSDGLIDLIIHQEQGGLFWLENLGNSNFSTPNLITNKRSVFKDIQFHDLDNDADGDIIFKESAPGTTPNEYVILRNNSTNRWTLETIQNTATSGLYAPSLFNETNESLYIVDDSLDLIIISGLYTNQPITRDTVFRFTNISSDFHSKLNNFSNNGNYVVYDFDNDSDEDFLYLFGDTIYAVENNSGSFSSSPLIQESGLLHGRHRISRILKMRDMNGDGYKDILVFKDSILGVANEAFYFENLRNGTFSNAQNLFNTEGFYSFGRTYQQFKYGDIDSDTIMDVFSIGQNYNTIIWHRGATLVGLNDFSSASQSGFKIFPNPSSNKSLNVDFGNAEFDGVLRVRDIQGRLVSEVNLAQQGVFQFEIIAEKGTYIVELQSDNMVERFKVILN